MLSALFAAALWINLATLLNAPVSTTHSIVGGVLGAGITVAGFGLVDWETMAAIVASWIVSPVFGAGFAALMLYFIKTKILYAEDRLAAANKWVPVLIALMAGAFMAYMRSEEHTSELQYLMRISYAVFCLKKQKTLRATH